ncbi:hypothetical protein L1049_012357 [Liquidambar formosana]|uniref:Uncharacterized protein n=1 Tax=Liquidambar formosana TaxID=63359 RepID=A0AAP0RT71_LIQFO
MDHSYKGRIPTKKLATLAASSNANQDPQTWYTDSGATNHITSDLANLSLHNEYRRKDPVEVGNSSGLKDGEDAFPRQE